MNRLPRSFQISSSHLHMHVYRVWYLYFNLQSWVMEKWSQCVQERQVGQVKLFFSHFPSHLKIPRIGKNRVETKFDCCSGIWTDGLRMLRLMLYQQTSHRHVVPQLVGWWLLEHTGFGRQHESLPTILHSLILYTATVCEWRFSNTPSNFIYQNDCILLCCLPVYTI